MASTVTLFQNVLPTSLGSEVSFKPPVAAPLADRQHIKLPPVQGSNFTGAAGSTIRFQVPSMNKFIDTSAGIRFGFQLQLGDHDHMYMNEGASSIIHRIRVLTSSEQQLEDLSAYNVWSRIQSNITVPAWQKSTALGICQGYAPQAANTYEASAGRGDGHYEVPLHSMILSNSKWLPLKALSGLVVEVTLAAPEACLVTDTTASYTLTSCYLGFDTVELTDAQKLEFDDAVRQAGGVLLTGRSWSVKQPQYVSPNGSVVISDRHSSQTGFILAWRNNAILTDKTKDSMQFAKPIDSIHTRIGGETLSARPITFTGSDVTEAFGMVLTAYGNHCLGAALNRADFSDSAGTSGTGSFVVAQTLETSSLVSGSSAARKAGVDIECVTTGATSSNSYSCIAFVSYNQCVSFNIDGTVDVFN